MTGVSEVVRNAKYSWIRLRGWLPKPVVKLIERVVMSRPPPPLVNITSAPPAADEHQPISSDITADPDEPQPPPAFILDFRQTVWNTAAKDETGSNNLVSGAEASDGVADGYGRCNSTYYGPETTTLPIPDRLKEGPDGETHNITGRGTWGLLLPICSHGAGREHECWERLDGFFTSLRQTTDEADRRNLTAYIAIDAEDDVYDTPSGKQRLHDMVSSTLGTTAKLYVMSAGWRYNVCWLWDFLGRKAVEHGEEFFVLLGDDVRLRSPGWKHQIEEEFCDISASLGLPFGVGVVAFRDEKFPVFPTFPVLHRVHLEVFGCVLPPVFLNQEADPYLFQVYRRFGASRFAGLARLQNTIGGLAGARYTKDKEVCWKGSLLSESVTMLQRFLWKGASDPPRSPRIRPLVCLDVVIPSYRCNEAHLSDMMQRLLGGADHCPGGLSVSVVVVVDNPDRFSSEPQAWHDFQQRLNSWTTGRWVRVWLQSRNEGASGARNRGLCQAAGDYVLFLDDDVVPSPTLLDSLAGAIARTPGAAVFVGQTVLPAPTQLCHHAVYTNNLNFFYRVATELESPPWGVTANLCIKNPERSGGGVYFDTRYPRGGGGEDIAFCLTLKDLHNSGPSRHTPAVVAVPEAIVEHPFWADVPRQVAGWASGDVLCLEHKPERSFCALPNWAEWLLLWALGTAVAPTAHLPLPPGQVMLAALWFPLTAAVLRLPDAMSNLHPEASAARWWLRACVGVLGVGLIMLQDLVRIACKLWTWRFHHLLLHFDWMDGQENHRQCVQLQLFASMVMSLLACSIHWAAVQGLIILSTALMACTAWLYRKWWTSHQDPVIPIRQGDDQPAGSDGEKSGRAAGVTSQSEAPIPFLVLGYQRTGTNLLCGRLFHAKPEVVMHNEMFDPRHIWTYHREKLSQDSRWRWGSAHLRDQDPQGFMEDIFTLSPQLVQDGPAVAVGHKLLPHMWRGSPALPPVFRRALLDRTVRKVVLRRENPLEVYVSLACAAASGQWIKENSDGYQVCISPAVFHSFLKHYEAWYAFYDDILTGQEVCRVSFEELADPVTSSRAMRTVLGYLGVDGARDLPDTDVATVKQSKVPALQKVANLPELQAAFRHTPWSKYLSAP